MHILTQHDVIPVALNQLEWGHCCLEHICPLPLFYLMYIIFTNEYLLILFSDCYMKRIEWFSIALNNSYTVCINVQIVLQDKNAFTLRIQLEFLFILAAYATQIIVLYLFWSKMHEIKKKILNFLKKMIFLNIVNRKQLMSSKNPLTSTWWKHLSNSACI